MGKLRHESGFTIIELMVGMTIALLASVAIFEVLLASESFKKTTLTGSDAMQNGSYAEFMLSRTLQMGGNGIAQVPNVWGCPLNIYRDNALITGSSAAYSGYAAPFNKIFASALASRSTGYSLPIAPVLIIDGGTGSDALVVMAGQHGSHGYYLSANDKPANGKVFFKNALGINDTCATTTGNRACIAGEVQQDLLLAVDQDAGAGSATCDVAQVKSVTSGVATLTGNHNSAHDYTGEKAFDSFSRSTKIANLGPVAVESSASNLKTVTGPLFLAYAIDDNANLIEWNILTRQTRTIASNIVTLKAIYGVAAKAEDTHVSDWVTASGSQWGIANITPEDIGRIRAVRLAIVARNATPDKETAPYSSFSLFPGSGEEYQYDIPDRKYRYQSYDMIVPLRNMVAAANNS